MSCLRSWWERYESDRETKSPAPSLCLFSYAFQTVSLNIFSIPVFKDNIICLKINSLIKENGALRSAVSIKLSRTFTL